MNNLSAANRLVRWAGIVALTLGAAAASAASNPAPVAEIRSLAGGTPCSVIRGIQLLRAGEGALLRPGDLIATSSGTLLILTFKSGETPQAIVAVGPSSRLYWMERLTGVSLAVRAGWIKVDTLALGQSLLLETQGPRLGAASPAGAYVLHVGESVDEVFHESGGVQLWTRSTQGLRTAAPSEPSQLSRRSADTALQSRRGPDAAFVDAMPPSFRDPLPFAGRPHTRSEPEWERDVVYADIAEWLAAPPDWRLGLTRRFRARLKDPAFLQAGAPRT